MRITIERIDVNTMKPLGYTQLPSFSATFSSSIVRGAARFVPASGNSRGCSGESFDVEIGQERVSGLKRVEHKSLSESVVALPEPGAFHICGTVASIVAIAEPPGNSVVTVMARGAVFTLSGEDLAETMLSLGERVAFTVHEMSLWDEAI